MNKNCNKESLGSLNEYKTSKDPKEEKSNLKDEEEKEGTLEKDIENLFS